MDVRVVISLLSIMVVASTGAPLEQEQQGASREKRAKEIVGSSLDADITRTKRIDPRVEAAQQQQNNNENEAVLDKKASIETESGPAEDLSKNSPDVPTTKSREQAIADENEIIEKLFGLNEDDIKQARLEEQDYDNKPEFKAEDMTEDEMNNAVESSEGKSEEEATSNTASEDDSLPNISESYEEVGSGEGPVEGVDDSYFEGLNDILYNYYDYPRYYPWLEPADYRRKRSAPKREERSLKSQAFTAEDMTGSTNNGRVKRDLEEDYVRSILGYPDNEEEEQREILGGLLEEALEEELAEEEAERGGYGYEEEETPTREEIEDTLQLLKYLYTSIPDEVLYEGSPYEAALEEPYEDEEPYENNYISKRGMMMDDDDSEFEPIMYNGEPGYFIPLAKRQFVSSVPGTRKRAFYPYKEEPYGTYAGLVGRSSMEEEKRNNMEYERLMRMAEALREPEWDKKK